MKRVIATPDAPKAVGPYSQAIEVNGTLYISGQIPVNPADGKIQDNENRSGKVIHTADIVSRSTYFNNLKNSLFSLFQAYLVFHLYPPNRNSNLILTAFCQSKRKARFIKHRSASL